MQRTPPKSSEGDSSASSGPRSKRQRPSNSPVQYIDKQDEILAMVSKVLSEIAELRKSNTEMKTSLEFLSQQYDELTGKIKTLQDEQKSDRAQIRFLETKIESLHRNARLTCVEIRNVPATENEKKDDLLRMVQSLNNNLQLNIDSSQIRDIYRSKSKTNNKPITVEFNNILCRDQFLTTVKKYNKNNINNRINSSLLGIPGQKAQVYISESLIPQTKRLYMKTKDLAKHKNFKYCWTSHGYVYLRLNDGSPLIRISSEDDLLKLKAD
ncbi:unnamed protein product [Colias eurytheme]|nr:unnamed protein product [Colias eurytheme]